MVGIFWCENKTYEKKIIKYLSKERLRLLLSILFFLSIIFKSYKRERNRERNRETDRQREREGRKIGRKGGRERRTVIRYDRTDGGGKCYHPPQDITEIMNKWLET